MYFYFEKYQYYIILLIIIY